MPYKNYSIECPSCNIHHSLCVEITLSDARKLKEGESVYQDGNIFCTCGARIDEWGTVSKVKGKIIFSAGVRGFIIPANYNFAGRIYE